VRDDLPVLTQSAATLMDSWSPPARPPRPAPAPAERLRAAWPPGMVKPKDLRNPAARTRLGGLARKEALTSQQRREIARNAALARHKRTTKKQRQEAARRAVQARWAKAKRAGA
jgi:hypothetical protein